MSRVPVRAFVLAVDGAALIGFCLLAPYTVPNPVLGLSLLASLALITGTSPVRIPTTKVSVNVADAFVLTALAAFGPMPACVVGLAAALAAIVRLRKPLHIAFNLGNMVASSAIASVVYLAFGGVAGAAVTEQVAPLFAATGAYFFSNTLLVSLAVFFDTGREFLAVWKESAIWTAVSTFAGLTLAAGLISAIAWIGPSGLALGVPPVWMLTMFYRTHKERQLAAQQRVTQVQEINVTLEDKVAERTQELQGALRDLEQANGSLVQSNRRLEEASRAKSLFLANVSHELRTPLNAVIGFSDLLRDPLTGPLNCEQEGFVADIQESGEHLLRLITNILDLTKIEAGKLEAQIGEVELARALEDSAAMLRPQAAGKQLTLEIDAAPGLGEAQLDPHLFRQVLINLLSNAVKFTPSGGRITVRSRGDGRDLVVEVSDTGIGIAAGDLERIFEEFYQVDSTYSRQYEGTGLGLALVRRMVELQNGTVEASSTPGKGTTFTCRFHEVLGESARLSRSLPVAAAAVEACSTAPEPRIEEPETSVENEIRSALGDLACTIVLVEDNPMNRKLARNVLRSHGYRVIEATSGEQALALAGTDTAQLILMDLQLPGMDGLEVTRRLKANPRTASVPIVALTAHALESDEQMAREAGCVGFITKPIRLASFPRQVAAFLGPQGPQSPQA